MATFDTDFAAADDQLAEVFGETVEYYRGSANHVDGGLTAEVITYGHESSDADGFYTISRPRGFLIAAADLVINAVTVTPQQGDTIKQTIAGTVHLFRVSRSVDRDAYEWVDVRGGSWLVHTKYVGTE